MSRFGCPRKLITDNAPAFKSQKMVLFCEKHGILLKHSTPYYPQGNGLAESSNKNIVNSLKKLLAENKKAWDSKLKYSLWTDRINKKKAIGTSPFQLVYGTKVVFPIQLGLTIMKFMQDNVEEPNEV